MTPPLPSPPPEKAMTEPTISPCPFCPDGGMPVFKSAGRAQRPTSCVQCEKCTAEGPPALTKERAVERWNLRSRVGDGVGEIDYTRIPDAMLTPYGKEKAREQRLAHLTKERT